jgi:ribosomal protein S18 acetylase RimI-like enzyme
MINIRKASLIDLETIQEISKKTFIETFAAVNTPENMEEYVKDHFNTQQLSKEISHPNSQFYLAFSGKDALGYLKLNFGNAQTDDRNEQALEVHRIYVLSEFHGKKVGQLLLDQAKQIAQQTGVPYIWLAVWEENHRALRFYSKNDFVAFDSHIFVLGDDHQTDLLMKLELNDKSK